jgi:hypothetical protein
MASESGLELTLLSPRALGLPKKEPHVENCERIATLLRSPLGSNRASSCRRNIIIGAGLFLKAATEEV